MGGTATVPMLSLDAGLTHYLAEIRKFPMLRPDQEAAYAKRWREHGDREAAYHLVTSHLRLVAKIAMRYRGYGLPIADIISEGNVGLMQAVKRFEPERGFRLATYAMWWIKASIQEYILRSWSLGRAVTAASAKRFAENLMPIIREIRAAGAARASGWMRWTVRWLCQPESRQTHRRRYRAAARAYALSTSTRKTTARFSVDDRCFVRSWYRARSSEVANRTRRIELLLQSGTPLDLIDLSLVSTLSSAQKASASWYFLAAKARSGLRSASMVKIESEGVSLIFSPSARPRPAWLICPVRARDILRLGSSFSSLPR